MKSEELRQKYLEFFKKHGHKVIPSASLIPENDPTVLFTTAGMHPLVPYLLGEKHPEGIRLTSCQKCIRTGDIDEVGDDTHLTFFEMLGNWSLGDYWKEDAIKWSFEFLTKELNIPLERLAVTCFAGDKDAPKDEESAKIWMGLGVKPERIAFLPKEDNWWGPAGKTGPCGPDTEMFYWKKNDEKAPKIFDPKNKNWVEIWNDVFMQYVKNEKGEYETAKQKNVDTGMGLERTTAILNGKENVYETDAFLPIIEKIQELSSKEYKEDEKAFRVIADHIKASVFLATEGIEPSNIERGYILRKLIRRQIRYSHFITMNNDYKQLVDIVDEIYGKAYPQIRDKKDLIMSVFKKEYSKFILTLEKGLKVLNNEIVAQDVGPKGELGKIHNLEIIDGIPNFTPGHITGEWLFDIYQTFGFPPELALEEIRIKLGRPLESFDIKRIMDEFEVELKKHQELSRTASAGMFKGGLADASEQTTKLHTATHLLLAGLRKVLGNHVTQKGSNITSERVRFDFLHSEKMSFPQVESVENFVNDIIKKDLPVWFEEMPIEKAREIGAMGVFESKYGQIVKVYFIGKDGENVSKEICGGPHVARTGSLGHFKIQKEESSSSGVRRIKAILE